MIDASTSPCHPSSCVIICSGLPETTGFGDGTHVDLADSMASLGLRSASPAASANDFSDTAQAVGGQSHMKSQCFSQSFIYENSPVPTRAGMACCNSRAGLTLRQLAYVIHVERGHLVASRILFGRFERQLSWRACATLRFCPGRRPWANTHMCSERVRTRYVGLQPRIRCNPWWSRGIETHLLPMRAASAQSHALSPAASRRGTARARAERDLRPAARQGSGVAVP